MHIIDDKTIFVLFLNIKLYSLIKNRRAKCVQLGKTKMSEQLLCEWCGQRYVTIRPWLFSNRGFCCPKCEYEYNQAHK